MFSQIKHLFKEVRPKQWTKNFFIFAAALFSREFNNLDVMTRLAVGFLIFCCISGLVYVINDWLDREKDKLHPEKKHRPIASGALNPLFALLVIGSLSVFGITISWFWLGKTATYVLMAYFFLNTCYSFWLKHAVIIDINSIAIGFILRVMFGVVVIKNVNPSISASPWLLLCTFFLALFLAAAKRRNELLYVEAGVNHRKSLRDYSEELIDSILSVAASASIICYSLYTVFIELPLLRSKHRPEPIHNLYYTVPLVVVGILRYKFLIFKRQEGGAPEKVLLTDRTLQFVILIWVITVLGLAYLPGYFK